MRIAARLPIMAGLLLAVAAAAQQQPPRVKCAWGGDVNRGAGPKLAASVHHELLAFLRLPAEARAKRAAELVRKRAVDAIEAWKRFRNPELVLLARACLDHDDWHVVHRGLHWARELRDPALLERAWALLDHPEPKLREKAAITCLELWDSGAAERVAGGRVRETLDVRTTLERDFHVRQALRALRRRVDGELEPDVVAPEVVVELDDGLRWAPFVPGLRHLAEVAPGVVVPQGSWPAGASAAALPVVERWNAPLLGYGVEEVPGIEMQPFGNKRGEGTLLHTGQDVGGCSDGAGIYALADGIVRYVSAGSDMGVGLVVEHHLAQDELVNAVYMHAGGTLLVTAGERVEGGQLLGTVGLSWSIENGGQFAHLHLGLYPGPFRLGHNYGYGPADEGLAGWLDPAERLSKWIAQ